MYYLFCRYLAVSCLLLKNGLVEKSSRNSPHPRNMIRFKRNRCKKTRKKAHVLGKLARATRNHLRVRTLHRITELLSTRCEKKKRDKSEYLKTAFVTEFFSEHWIMFKVTVRASFFYSVF